MHSILTATGARGGLIPMTRSHAVLSLCLFALLAGPAAGRAAGEPAAPSPAAEPGASPIDWQRHYLLVSLRNLPKHYSCDDLWYKFRDVLTTIGAPPFMQILPYECEDAGSRSPKVQLKFVLPETVSMPSNISAVSRTVRLAPGQPASLDAGDCELIRQITNSVLESLPVHIIDSTLNCSPPESAAPQFAMSIQALVPILDKGEARPAANRAAPANGKQAR
jgi:hypothetical protein